MNIQKDEVGVGPHPLPWPEDDKYDRALLAEGDRRNVLDQYRYWSVEAIKEELASRSGSMHVAIENWQHDMNIGTIVRNANAFNAEAVHIIGKRHWNRRGAMATEKYLSVYHHETINDFIEAVHGRSVIAIDNIAGSVSLASIQLPKDVVFVFGGEGPGLSQEMVDMSEKMIAIEQFGSTRSVNVGVASGIIMYTWARQYML